MTANVHEKVDKTILSNGLKIVTEYIPTVRSVAVGIWVKTGSRDERDEQAGITHFLEHMLFKGTKNRSAFQIVSEIEGVGGYLNAFTATEYTCYYVRCLDSELARSLDVLADMILQPLFPKKELEKEKKVVIEEMKMYRDSPDDFIFEEFSAQLFQNNPLGRPIIGFESTVNAYKQEHLFDYVEQRYRPDNLIISVAGNLEHDEVVNQAERLFGNLKKEPTYNFPKVLTPYHQGTKTLTKSIEQTHYIIGRRGISSVDEQRYLLLLMNTVLSGGMSSRLHQNIREKYGYCYSINSFIQSFTDTGMFGVYIGTDKDYITHVKDLIMKEFDQLMTQPIPEKELNESKSQLKGKLLLAQESMNNRMTRLAKSEIYFDRYVELDEIVQDIDAVKANDIQQFAASFLQADQFSETLLLPES